jgi:uncharacterized 2Fe-2S/4Fe-4S cluster protein (DUF4445 family)
VELTNAKCKIRFLPDDIEIAVDKGTTLLAAAIASGVHINAACGGAGVCGTCKVKIDRGTAETTRSEKLSEEEYHQGIRQACQTRALTDLVVNIPPGSRLGKAVHTRERKKSAGVSSIGWRFDPPLSKYYLELTSPTLDDNASDLFRLMRGLKQSYGISELPIDFEVIRKLPEVTRENDFKVTVSALLESDRLNSKRNDNRKIVNIEAGDTRGGNYAVAIDVGTTTVCAQLVDLNRAEILADTITFNKQSALGADVITRINYCQQPDGLTQLHEMVVASINEDIDALLSNSHVERKDIGYIVLAGNTTMQQILLGLDPKYIRLAPYTPTANFVPLVKAHQLGINLADHVYINIFPSVSSYVGGDIVSGVISAGVHQRKKVTFYMDIGTNGEIVIGNSDWMVTASCSAGPAFEGGGIRFGMVAVSGAIQDFSLDSISLEPTIKTIEEARPRGICGSGLINTIASLFEAGIIGQNGKFNTHLHSSRIRPGTEGYEYVMAWAAETQIGQDIVITEADIDNLIRSKAAMYAGCRTLSKAVNMDCLDFEQVILAGNFGSSLNIENAILIGLLPDIPRDRFVFIGNGSLSGARLAAFSTDMVKDSRKVAQMMTNIELSENNEFTDNYIAALFIPHTDEKAFPNVSRKINRR